jgi:hypothetical protein
MRIAHLTDLHLTDGPRLAEQAEELGRIAATMIAVRPHLIALTGDFYGHTVPHRSSVAERRVLFGFVARLARALPETRIIVVYGNHDFPGDLEPLAHLGADGQVTVHDRADAVIVGKCEVLILPFVTKAGILSMLGPDAGGLADLRAATQRAVAGLLGLWAARGRAPGCTRRVLLGHVQISGSKLSGGEVLVTNEPEVTVADLQALNLDAGMIGHIHVQQEAAPRVWFGGSPWSSDYGEHDPKGWMLWCFGESVVNLAYSEVVGDYGDATAYRIASRAPRLLTLRYAWDGAAWAKGPNAAALAACAGHHVRAVVRYRADQRASVPELAPPPGALSWRVDADVIPTERVRAPEVADAPDLGAKISAYWRTLATPPTEAEQAAALALLPDLESSCAP